MQLVDFATIPTFIVAVLAILIAPGPDMMFMIGTGLSAGKRGAVAGAFGVTAGVTIYVVGSALGLAVLVERVPEVLDVIRALGGVYLIYLAVTTWRQAGARVQTIETTAIGLGGIFRRGFIVNLMNPKVALFIAAFIPQFVDAERGRTTAQFLVFAIAFQVLGLTVDLIIGIAAGSTRSLVVNRPDALTGLDRLAALVYLAIAGWLLLELLR